MVTKKDYIIDSDDEIEEAPLASVGLHNIITLFSHRYIGEGLQFPKAMPICSFFLVTGESITLTSSEAMAKSPLPALICLQLH